MCDANFQCCLHTQYDQGFSPGVCAKVRARSFQWWENFMPFEGPVGVWWRCYNWPTKFPKKDVKCIKLFLVQGTTWCQMRVMCEVRCEWCDVSMWMSETCMPKQAPWKHNKPNLIKFTFHVHQLSVNEGKSSHRIDSLNKWDLSHVMWDVNDMVRCDVWCEWWVDKWDEMRWDEMRWDEMRCDAMRCDAMPWDEMWWDEMWCDVGCVCDASCEWCGDMCCEMWVMCDEKCE